MDTFLSAIEISFVHELKYETLYNMEIKYLKKDDEGNVFGDIVYISLTRTAHLPSGGEISDVWHDDEWDIDRWRMTAGEVTVQDMGLVLVL